MLAYVHIVIGSTALAALAVPLRVVSEVNETANVGTAGILLHDTDGNGLRNENEGEKYLNVTHAGENKELAVQLESKPFVKRKSSFSFAKLVSFSLMAATFALAFLIVKETRNFVNYADDPIPHAKTEREVVEAIEKLLDSGTPIALVVS